MSKVREILSRAVSRRAPRVAQLASDLPPTKTPQPTTKSESLLESVQIDAAVKKAVRLKASIERENLCKRRMQWTMTALKIAEEKEAKECKVPDWIRQKLDQIEERMEELKSKFLSIQVQLSHVDDEINRAMARRRSALEDKNYEVADRMFETGRLMIQRKNDLTQFKLKTLGREFGDLMNEKTKLMLEGSPELMTGLLNDFDVYVLFLKPKAFHYNMLLKGYAKLGSGVGAEDVFSEMLEREVTPDYMSYVAMMEAWISEDNVSKVLLWKKKMAKELKKPLTGKILDELIRYFATKELYVEMRTLLLQAKKDVQFFLHDSTISAILNLDSTEDKLVELMLPILNEFGLEKCLRYYLSQGRTQSVVRLMVEYQKRNLKPHLDNLDSNILKVTLQTAGHGGLFSDLYSN